MKMIENVSDWLSYAGGALIKVTDSAGSAVDPKFKTVTVQFGLCQSWLEAMKTGFIVS